MLTISRPNVPSDRIVPFSASERFLKIPVENYINLLGIEPAPPQVALINGINDPRFRFVVACFSRRVGKTYISNVIAQLVALVPGANILLISPNYNLTTISWDLQRSLINKFDIEVKKNNQKDRVITLTNDSSIRMGSVSQADSLVGRSYDLILFDEAAIDPNGKDVFNIQLRPTLDKMGSKAIFISTPRGLYNYFYEFYMRGFSDDFPDWVSMHCDWRDNPRAKEEDIKAAEKSMSRAEFRQEYYADFTVFEGRIWSFDAEKCSRDLSGLPFWEMDVIAGIDIGFRDPTVMCVIAYDHVEGKYYVLDEYWDNEAGSEQHARRVKELEDKYGISMIFIDSAAAQTRFDWAQQYDVATINAKKSVLDGIEAVGRLTDNDKLIVDEKCTHVLEALDQYQWDDRKGLEKQKPKHNDACHMADAIRYAIYTYTV